MESGKLKVFWRFRRYFTSFRNAAVGLFGVPPFGSIPSERLRLPDGSLAAPTIPNASADFWLSKLVSESLSQNNTPAWLGVFSVSF
ncbi:MAG: hypothetical protein IJP90_14130 [Treponema sp.]|nr:hypothetical protein [Treponema sp.]